MGNLQLCIPGATVPDTAKAINVGPEAVYNGPGAAEKRLGPNGAVLEQAEKPWRLCSGVENRLGVVPSPTSLLGS